MSSISAYHSSTVDVSGGEVTGSFYARDTSAVDISGGEMGYIYAYNTSAVDISGGEMRYIYAEHTSTVNVSGGEVNYSFYADGSSTVNISGGTVNDLDADGSSTVDISGGTVNDLDARDNSAVTFYARDFRFGGGLSLNGDRVLGEGPLSGEWLDGTRWVVNIVGNTSWATILAITVQGDLDGDGWVGQGDLDIVLGAWGQSVPPADPQADTNNDGTIGQHDLDAVLSDWGQSTPPAPVPEPVSFALLLAAALLRLKFKPQTSKGEPSCARKASQLGSWPSLR